MNQISGFDRLSQFAEVHTDLLQQGKLGLPHGGLLQIQAASDTQQHMPLRGEFIALGVSAEVVMVVEDQNFGVRAILLAEQVSSSQAANACPYDDQII